MAKNCNLLFLINKRVLSSIGHFSEGEEIFKVRDTLVCRPLGSFNSDSQYYRLSRQLLFPVPLSNLFFEGNFKLKLWSPFRCGELDVVFHSPKLMSDWEMV